MAARCSRQAPVLPIYEKIVGSKTTFRLLNNKWTTVYYEDGVPNTSVPGASMRLARRIVRPPAPPRAGGRGSPG